MAFIGSLLGAGKGSDYVAGGGNPQMQGNPTNTDQINNSYTQTQQGLAQQQAFLQALQAQNGIGNQSQVYNQLQGVANGTGPNPAQAQLAQATSANTANQAALMAGQRGVGANPGMLARQAAQQGAANQQNAAGQAATLQANQSLNALGQAGNIAGQQVQNVGQALTGYNQFAQNQQGNLLGAQGQYENAQAGILANQNTTNSATQIQNSKAQQGIFGGLLGGAGGILSDKNEKTDIKDASGKIKDFLDKAGSHEYEYKDPSKPGAAPGKHIGPMAQELEKSELGRKMVTDTSEGKGVDFQRGLGTIVAAQAALNKRLEALEGGKKKYAAGGVIDAPAMMQQAPQAAPQQVMAPPPAMPANQPMSAAGRFLNGFNAGMNPPQNEGAAGGGDNPVQGGMSKFTENLGKKLLGLKPDQTLLGNAASPTDAVPKGTMADSGAPSAGSVTSEDIGADAAGSEAAGEGAEAGEAAEGAEAGEAAEGASSVGELAAALNKGGRVPAMVSPGEVYLSPSKLKEAVEKRKDLTKAGEKIPGKAKVKGDSVKNDTVPKTLEAGGMVIPKHVMESKNPAKEAAKFVAAVMKRSALQGKRK